MWHNLRDWFSEQKCKFHFVSWLLSIDLEALKPSTVQQVPEKRSWQWTQIEITVRFHGEPSRIVPMKGATASSVNKDTEHGNSEVCTHKYTHYWKEYRSAQWLKDESSPWHLQTSISQEGNEWYKPPKNACLSIHLDSGRNIHGDFVYNIAELQVTLIPNKRKSRLNTT